MKNIRKAVRLSRKISEYFHMSKIVNSCNECGCDPCDCNWGNEVRKAV